jgi:hypothetical protein
MPKTYPTKTVSAESRRQQHELPSPVAARRLVDRLNFQHAEQSRRLLQTEAALAELEQYLGIAGDVSAALETLSQKLFEEVLGLLEEKLTIALHEVLDQPIKFKATADFKRGSAVVDFSIERDGFGEDVERGQGGSVQNILSVGLRMFALATLDPAEHRRFLVLDEQDCWLRPELVPRLVNIVDRAAKELGFQVLMISHHDTGWFEKFADRIYRLSPSGEGVIVEQVNAPPMQRD